MKERMHDEAYGIAHVRLWKSAQHPTFRFGTAVLASRDRMERLLVFPTTERLPSWNPCTAGTSPSPRRSNPRFPC
eukprot:CAMPEP_0113924804 /NCGR_PEP_ID=MMETSP1159-20121227/2864_1 /TAXON_ID=88271 /ORGANISM="Picocystis salinarum" /LENGTH=74 /DNA_ID=CAMNT_0000925049 /DNA_START=424 /DNA_END=645 /DNA_ORIENTATION=+ /assembly_acc=CAM_ASM_000767